MLSHPSNFLLSKQGRNNDNSLFLDWLESTSLFLEEEFSQTDIVDHLVEEQLYEDQSVASEFVLSEWVALKQRLSWLGSYSPIGFKDRWVVRQLDWRKVPAHSYCLVVSFGPKCDGWSSRFGRDYTEQGRLFELITRAAMESRFSGWRFLHTGWARDKASKLSTVIGNLISAIDERKGNPDNYLARDAKDAGVDLIWHLPFADGRGGAPVYLAQCASGENWVYKVNEPNINEWTKIVDFAAVPNKAFSLPFSLGERELRRQSNQAGGLLLDRYRLLAHSVSESKWVPAPLRQDLIDWLEPRIDWIINR